MLWEQKIEKRLEELGFMVSNLKDEITGAISKANGGWKVLTILGYLILAFFTVWPTIHGWLRP